MIANLLQNVIAAQKIVAILEEARAKKLEQDTQKRRNAVK